MQALNISKQTEAEKDNHLLECFYDSGAIKQLIDEKYPILAGRKGIGKSAIAKYLEAMHEKFDIDFAIRLSIRNFNTNLDEKASKNDTLGSILKYIAIKTAKKLIDKDLIKGESKKFWNDFFVRNGLQIVNDYESFITSSKSTKKTLRLKRDFLHLLLAEKQKVAT